MPRPSMLERRHTPVLFRDPPVLDAARRAIAAQRKARDVTCGIKPVRDAQPGIDHQTAILRARQGFGIGRRGRDAEADDYKVGRNAFAILEPNGAHIRAALQRGGGARGAEGDAALRMQADESGAHLAAELLLERYRLAPDHRDVEPAFAQAGRDLHADEACAEDHGARAALRLREDRLRICAAAQNEDVAEPGAGNVVSLRHATGREQGPRRRRTSCRPCK